MICQTRRNRTRIRRYSLCHTSLYFLGLLLRNTSKAISRLVNRSHTAIRDWIQRYKPEELLSKRKKIDEYIVDQTLIKVDSTNLVTLDCNQIDPENKQILALLQKYQKRETCLWLRRSFCQI